MKSKVSIKGQAVYKLTKGENPYQSPAVLFSQHTKDPLALDKFRLISGEAPGYTNLCSLDRLVQTISRTYHAFFVKYRKAPYIVIASKHGNPCGFGIDWDNPEIAVEKALFGNHLAIWGGEVICNFKITDQLAAYFFESPKRKRLTGRSRWMLDIIASCGFSKSALSLLGGRTRRKLFINPGLSTPALNPAKWSFRFTRGSFIRQKPMNYILDLSQAEQVPIKFKLTTDETDSLIIAWAVAYNSNHGGNEIAFAKNRALISCGGGPSTIEAAQLAVYKAKNQKHEIKGAVFAADAFFPFTDVPELLIKNGVVTGVVPAGGQDFSKIKDIFKKHHLPIYYLPEEFRGFCYH